jgi:NAD(P)-dependent dehydrogenase (short-subunit alcohol dehydrogenase family)
MFQHFSRGRSLNITTLRLIYRKLRRNRVTAQNSTKRPRTFPLPAPIAVSPLSTFPSQMPQRPIAIVTGASRGLGRALANALSTRGYAVVAVVRAPPRAPLPLRSDVRVVVADLSCPRAVELLAADLARDRQAVRLLVNNAAVCPAGWGADDFDAAFQVNVAAPTALAVALFDFPCASHRSAHHPPTVLNVSSGDGELLYFSPQIQSRITSLSPLEPSSSDSLPPDLPTLLDALRNILQIVQSNTPPSSREDAVRAPQPAYALSKAALNAVTRAAAPYLREVRGVRVINVCPGDLDTRMCDEEARDVVIPAKKAASELISLVERGWNAGDALFFRHGKPIPW